MKKLPIGIQTFEKIRKNNYIYIDKTAQALNLIENGLYIYDKYDWSKSYPVIKISFAEGNFHSKKELNKRIIDILKDNQKLLGVECEDPEDVVRCFQTLIVSAYEKYNSKVVVLVDEYDKPILDNINNVEIANELRDSLRNFYSVIKGSDQYLKFAFLTGVSKFSKVSLFSGLNNLEDITLKSDYSSICGYTQSDVEKSFKEYFIDVNMEELKTWYNGYSWLGESLQPL